MIYRTHFPESIPCSQNDGRESLAKKIAHACRAFPSVMLLPRDAPYALPSGMFGDEFHQRAIFVQFDGRAIFANTREYLQCDMHGEYPLYVPDPDRECVELIVLPDQELFVMITLPGKNLGELLIVEVVYYYPTIPWVHPKFPFSLS